MTEKQLDFIISFHTKLYRQGPGSDEETHRAIKLTGLSESHELNVLDLGCGTGAQTNVLANHLNGIITALDLFQPFLDELEHRVKSPNVRTFQGSMDDLPFEKESFDLIGPKGRFTTWGLKMD